MLETSISIVVVLVFNAVCDLEIMNDNAYATNIITVQKRYVNNVRSDVLLGSETSLGRPPLPKL